MGLSYVFYSYCTGKAVQQQGYFDTISSSRFIERNEIRYKSYDHNIGQFFFDLISPAKPIGFIRFISF